MRRERFPITSEQMELLLAFETAGNLENLSDLMGKDASVVSRNLQKLSSDLPVLRKDSGRWRITPLGRQVNLLTRDSLVKLKALASEKSDPHRLVANLMLPSNTLLLVINAQKALHDPAQSRRSNSAAENNISQILAHWRKMRRPIIHVKHVSENPASFFHRGSPGIEFISELAPKRDEPVFEKSKASAFTGTKLEKHLQALKVKAMVIVGFTGGECVDATARQACDLGYRTIVIGDATATFDLVGPNGKLHKAAKVHRNVLATLHALFAQVVETETILSQ